MVEMLSLHAMFIGMNAKMLSLPPIVSFFLVLFSLQLRAATVILGDDFFASQGVPLNGPVAGVYDLFALTGVAGLEVEVFGNAIRTTSNNGLVLDAGQNVRYVFSNTAGGSALVDGRFSVGTGLFARESNQLATNGTITNAAAASVGVSRTITDTLIRYANLSTTSSVVQSPHSYEVLNGTSFNFSVINLNGIPNQSATFIPIFTVPEPSAMAFLVVGGFILLRKKRV